MTDTTQPPAETLAEGALNTARDFIMSADNTSGYCMCGSPVEGHGIGDGHSPVDDGSYRALQVVECIDEALAALTRPVGGDAIPAGMKPWHGGDCPPADWDETKPVGYADWSTGVLPKNTSNLAWSGEGLLRITAYTPKPPAGGDAGARELLDEAIEHIGLLVSVDPGPKANAVFAAARAWFERQDAALALPAPVVEVSRDMLAEVMQDAWGEICDDAAAHPSDMQHGRGTVLFYRPAHWTDLIALRLNERLAALSEGRSHG